MLTHTQQMQNTVTNVFNTHTDAIIDYLKEATYGFATEGSAHRAEDNWPCNGALVLRELSEDTIDNIAEYLTDIMHTNASTTDECMLANKQLLNFNNMLQTIHKLDMDFYDDENAYNVASNLIEAQSDALVAEFKSAMLLHNA